MTPHIESKKEDIAKIVLMPGDPLRAKYIAENFLTDARLINSVRNMYAYTGKYNEKEITVFASGMGMPSMGIYCYELFKFYDVEYIIRLGTCGAYIPEINLLDTILVENSYTEGNFAHSLTGENCHIIEANKDLNNLIEQSALDENIKLFKGNIICSEVFDYYVKDFDEFKARFPQDMHIIGAEMESFALFYTAKYLNKKASCLLTAVDSRFKDEEITSSEREKSLNSMIQLALKSIEKIPSLEK